MAYRICANCGIVIETPFWLCQSCEVVLGVDGLPYRRWPKHVHNLVEMSRRGEREASGHGLVSWDEVPEDSATTDLAGDIVTLPWAVPGDMQKDDILPYAPYDDDEANRMYRAANGIAE